MHASHRCISASVTPSKAMITHERTPLVTSSPRFETDILPQAPNEANEDGVSAPPRRCCCGRCGFVALLVLAALPLVFFLGFQCLVQIQMNQAWREAFRPFQLESNATVDPLQGVRPAFLFDQNGRRIHDTHNSTLAAADPLVVIHGVEITAFDMDREAELLARLLPGTYVQSVEYAPGVVTYFQSLDDQLDALCLRLREHHVFGRVRSLDIMGHSSGAILARAVAQNTVACWGRQDVQVRHYVGLAGPQQGVVAPIPGRAGRVLAESLLGPWLVSLSRFWWVQRYIVSTATYLYNPRSMTDNVETNFGPASLLGRLNQGHLLSEYDRLHRLCGNSSNGISAASLAVSNTLSGPFGISGSILLVSSMWDEVIRPRESPFFSVAVGLSRHEDWAEVFEPGVSPSVVLRPLCDTDLWRRDTIGLRALWMQGRVFVYRSPTKHGPLTDTDYVQVVAPFFRGETTSYINGTMPASSITMEPLCQDRGEQTMMQVLVAS